MRQAQQHYPCGAARDRKFEYFSVSVSVLFFTIFDRVFTSSSVVVSLLNVVVAA